MSKTPISDLLQGLGLYIEVPAPDDGEGAYFLRKSCNSVTNLGRHADQVLFAAMARAVLDEQAKNVSPAGPASATAKTPLPYDERRAEYALAAQVAAINGMSAEEFTTTRRNAWIHELSYEQFVAQQAVAHADALLDELAKPRP